MNRGLCKYESCVLKTILKLSIMDINKNHFNYRTKYSFQEDLEKNKWILDELLI